MRRLNLLGLGFILSHIMLYAQGKVEKVEVDEGMPEFVIVHDDDTRLTIGPYLNKVILISFFKMDCEACLQELNRIDRQIWPEYHEYADFILLAIGVGHTYAELKEFKEKRDFAFPLYSDELGEIFDMFALGENVPRTYLVDKSNHVVFLSEDFSPVTITKLKEKLRKVFRAEPFYDDPLQTEE